MECIRLECDRLVSAHRTAELTVRQQVSHAKQLMKVRIPFFFQLLTIQTMDTIQAGQCRAPPPQPAPPNNTSLMRRHESVKSNSHTKLNSITRSVHKTKAYNFYDEQHSDSGTFIIDLDDLRYPLPGQSMLKRSVAMNSLDQPVRTHTQPHTLTTTTSAYNTDSNRSTPFTQTVYTDAHHLQVVNNTTLTE
jgi:hypothetical protein